MYMGPVCLWHSWILIWLIDFLDFAVWWITNILMILLLFMLFYVLGIYVEPLAPHAIRVCLYLTSDRVTFIWFVWALRLLMIHADFCINVHCQRTMEAVIYDDIWLCILCPRDYLKHVEWKHRAKKIVHFEGTWCVYAIPRITANMASANMPKFYFWSIILML